MKKSIYCGLLIAYCLLFIPSVRAEYVLPYPSFMPGNKIYRIMRIVDGLKHYWYFGNIGQIKYHLGLSDKYLVEAHTLMEYNQYLLATDALIRSDKEFLQLSGFIQAAKKENIDTDLLTQNIADAAAKHTEVLSEINESVPSQFTWTPEKSEPTELHLSEMLMTSVEIRKKVTADIQSF
jgi:hypothetical protein